MGLVGSFAGGPVSDLGGGSPEYLPFIHNPDAKPAFITPFHNNVISWYRVEYNLERARHAHPELTHYPSRLWALYLLNSRTDAEAYAVTHPEHVGNRVLKRCVMIGPYLYSIHDAASIDFLMVSHSMDDDTWSLCAHRYWSGAR
jgi:hypothetical protein